MRQHYATILSALVMLSTLAYGYGQLNQKVVGISYELARQGLAIEDIRDRMTDKSISAK